MESIAYGISVFVGLVAGVIVSLIVEALKENKKFKNEKKNLLFEMKCNISKIEVWKKELETLRKYNYSDRIVEFGGYFNLSLILYATSTRMLQQGTLYKCLSLQNVEGPLETGNYLNIAWENQLNSRIMACKQAFLNGTHDKQAFDREIDVWQNLLEKCRKNYLSIEKELN